MRGANQSRTDVSKRAGAITSAKTQSSRVDEGLLSVCSGLTLSQFRDKAQENNWWIASTKMLDNDEIEIEYKEHPEANEKKIKVVVTDDDYVALDKFLRERGLIE